MSWTHVIQLCSKLRQRIIPKLSPRSFSNVLSTTPKEPLKSLSKTAEAKDIVMFKYENPRFYNLLNIFAISQLVFWIFLATSSTTLKDVPVSEKDDKKEEKKDEEEVPFWRNVNFGQDKYKYGLGIGSILMGYGIFFVSWTYILKSVRFLILLKDRKHVAFVTYAPFGKNRIMKVPIDCISAEGSRASLATQMPVKVKGKRLFYILDIKEGSFPQPKLFDQTVGLQRKF